MSPAERTATPDPLRSDPRGFLHIWSRFNTPRDREAHVIRLVLFRLRWALLIMLVLGASATLFYRFLQGFGWVERDT
jgi:hypothetical protein